MKKIDLFNGEFLLLNLITLFLICGGLFNGVSAQEIANNRIDDDGDGLIDCMDPDTNGDPDCWECLTEFYQVHSNTYLVALDPRTGLYQQMATISGAEQINGLQFNPIDGHVYAPCIINGQHRLGKLNPDGTVIDLGLDLPGNAIFYVGAIDANGIMYVANASGIFSIDLTASTLSVVDTGVAFPGVADFALDITRGIFYGVTSGAQLKVFDPYHGLVDTYQLAGSIQSDSGGYGAAWSSNDGSFFAYNNSSGKIYSVDVLDLTATEVLNATGNLSINDGFNCVLAPPPFESNCTGGIDEDGDGLIDCDDPDCYTSNRCVVEICDNGLDDDNDGWIDCSDSECFSLSVCVEICDNGIDDNGNGLIDGDDPQCNTSSGIKGGLESNRRLSDKIAQRNFTQQVLDPVEFKEKQEGLIPFTQSAQKSKYNIASFIPEEALDAYVAETSPEDLVGITNAAEVAAADYYVDNQRVASVLAIASTDGVYEHTKYICDRLDGSILNDISYINIKGGNMITYELLRPNGQKEYAISFSAYHKEDKGFFLENHWSIGRYSDGEDYYNFQVWSRSMSELITLTESIYDKMMAKDWISNNVCSTIPQVFVMHGEYTNGRLKLIVKNKNRSKELSIRYGYTEHEGGEVQNREITVPLSQQSQEVIYLETGHIYDLGASLSTELSAPDEIFIADGTWGVDDQNPNAIVNLWSVAPQTTFGRDDIYQIERSIRVQAQVKDYLNIYRSLDVKLNAKNLNASDALSFDAAGEGDVEITIVRKSIEDWSQQMRTYLTLDEETRHYELRKADFAHAQDKEIDWCDVSMIVFTLLGDNDRYETKTIELSDVYFGETAVSTSVTETIESHTATISPNPTADQCTINLYETTDQEKEVNVYNMNGALIYTTVMPRNENEVTIDMTTLPVGLYNIRVSSATQHIFEEKILKIK